MPRPVPSRPLALLFLLLLPACGLQCGQPGDGATPERASLAAADALIKQRQLEPATQMLLEITARPDAQPAEWQRLAQVYVAREEPAKAIKTLRDGEQRFPQAGELPLTLARLYFQIGRYADAKGALERARAAHAPEADVALLLGQTIASLGDMAGAQAEFERAIAAGGDAKLMKYNLAVVLVQQRELGRARQLLEEALALDPQWPEAKRELAHVLLLSQPDKPGVDRAMDMLWSLKDTLKDDWHFQEYLGDGWLLLGDYDASIAAYTEALRLGRSPQSIQEKYVIAKRKQKEAHAAAQGVPVHPDAAPATTPKRDG